jgi:hypothetical protein
MSSSCCGCPFDKVDWTSEYQVGKGLCCCNYPWTGDEKYPTAAEWFFEDDREIIIIPVETTLMPLWILLCLPCVWCILFPLSSAQAWVIQEENGNVSLESRNKTCCFEIQNFKRKNITLAKLQTQTRKLLFTSWEEVALIIENSGGTFPDRTSKQINI